MRTEKRGREEVFEGEILCLSIPSQELLNGSRLGDYFIRITTGFS